MFPEQKKVTCTFQSENLHLNHEERLLSRNVIKYICYALWTYEFFTVETYDCFLRSQRCQFNSGCYIILIVTYELYGLEFIVNQKSSKKSWNSNETDTKINSGRLTCEVLLWNVKRKLTTMFFEKNVLQISKQFWNIFPHVKKYSTWVQHQCNSLVNKKFIGKI